jgi:hypothetical protein
MTEIRFLVNEPRAIAVQPKPLYLSGSNTTPYRSPSSITADDDCAAAGTRASATGDLPSERELFVNDFHAILCTGTWFQEFLIMVILKVQAVMAAVLFMSVSADAMEFADRPGTMFELSAPRAIRSMPADDCLRRQIDSHVILLPAQAAERKFSDRPRPVSRVPVRLSATMSGDRRGRLSAEFSAIARGSVIRFEHWAGVVSSRLGPIPAPTAMRFENRPGPILNRFKALAAVSNKFADRRGFTSSLVKTTVEFCLGSIAPCGPVSFVPRLGMDALSAAFHDARL